MTLRAVIYARFSSDMQQQASIDDQVRLCRERVTRECWELVQVFADRAISGASSFRPQYQAMLEGARDAQFDVIVSEALDRLSRDQEDIAALYKRLRFAGIKLITVSEGEIGELHIGLKGTMNALFLKDLAQKTHRGLRGRVEAGKSGGGLCYGYQVVRELGRNGMVTTGERRIDENEAEVIRRIFRDFAHGASSRRIALRLNDERVRGPGGEGWTASTINGNPDRGTGILNNELYVGRLVWNRLRYIKDPDTSKRISRPNPREAWIIKEVPDLRIVDQGAWEAVKARQAIMKRNTRPDLQKMDAPASPVGRPFWAQQRPRYLLSGLMRCGACGGAYSKISKNLFGCAAARNKGICGNRLNIRVEAVESEVLDGLKTRLMDPALFKFFCDEFVRETNRLIQGQQSAYHAAEAELLQLKARRKRMVEAIADGMPARSLCEEMVALEARENELNAMLAARPDAKPFLHPNMAELYREKVASLHEALKGEDVRDEAFNIIRSLIDEVRLVPENKDLKVELRGALAGILQLIAATPKLIRAVADGSVSVLAEQIKVVAGRGFEPLTFRL
jgi:site-specific DNA recombinase